MMIGNLWFACSGMLLAALLCLTRTHCVAGDTDNLNLCLIQTSCKNCLESSSSCAWCSHWEYSNSSIGKPRCNVPSRLRAFGCPDRAIEISAKGSVTLVENEDFQDVIVDQIPVQLKPQKVRIKLRPHSTETIKVQYRPAKNYPLDLYYLMDLTWSMKDDKETLVGLGWKMAHTLGNFTSNFRLGFGSYADKPLMPYVFPNHENNPCKSERATCAPLYSFKHHMRLSSDVQQFIQKVNASDITGNVDNLEGGMDGVVQAVLCVDQVGWIHRARKLMLVATDGLLHFAGDGKLGGVVHRHDFQCHLNENGEYSMSKEFDYPSLAEVSRLLKAHKVNLIFAVTEERREEYELITDLLKEKARVATLAANSSNILEIVEKAYHEIITKVILRDNSTGPFAVKYYSDCGSDDGPELQTSECNGLQEGHVYDFKIKFSLEECPQNQSLWRQTVVIDDALASKASETAIEIELLCGCDCGNEGDSRCKQGFNECGICKCNFGWSGEICDCEENDWTKNKFQCVNAGETEICSNRGECLCGSCSCDPGYNGPFCECSPCDKIDGIECGGKGTCDCGVCLCLAGWEGTGCQCPSGNDPCIPPGSNEICANHGYCECGQCRCNKKALDGLYYRGTYCESSAGAGGSGLCGLYTPCVNATLEEPENAQKFCRMNATLYKTRRVNKVDLGSDQYCFIRIIVDTTVCTIPYVYEFNKDNTVTLNIADKFCHTPMSAGILPGIVFAAVVLLGIIGLFIWKCWTSIKDNREYAKFEREQKRTVYALDENPLYKPATTRFRVPSMFKED